MENDSVQNLFCQLKHNDSEIINIIIKWVLNSGFVEQRKLDELNYLICGQISTEMSA